MTALAIFLKISADIFVGPQIKVMLACKKLDDKMSAVEKKH